MPQVLPEASVNLKPVTRDHAAFVCIILYGLLAEVITRGSSVRASASASVLGCRSAHEGNTRPDVSRAARAWVLGCERAVGLVAAAAAAAGGGRRRRNGGGTGGRRAPRSARSPPFVRGQIASCGDLRQGIGWRFRPTSS
eukprot:6903524-Prymnesium_polylepis.1